MTDARNRPPTVENRAAGVETARGAVFADDAEVERLRLALAGVNPDSQIAEWWRELREMHESGGMSPADARRIAYRQARIAELLSRDIASRSEIARRVGCSEVTVRTDIAALRRLLEPRTRFVGEREAA